MVAHRCFTEFLGCFMIIFLSLLTAKFLLRYNPTSNVFRAAVAGFVFFFAIWLVLFLGGDPILSPVSAVMSTVKGKYSKTHCTYYVGAQLAGFVAGYLAYRYILILVGEEDT